MFADDRQCWLVKQNYKHSMDDLNRDTRDCVLKINIKKTKVMCFCERGIRSFTLWSRPGSGTSELVEEFRYSILPEDE